MLLFLMFFLKAWRRAPEAFAPHGLHGRMVKSGGGATARPDGGGGMWVWIRLEKVNRERCDTCVEEGRSMITPPRRYGRW